ncbi:MAG: TetR/AcrR family transcriptional regulator [Anaerolineaceae bacterium]|nr:TetR/AcrR family transcriptional regulator [Anaerolineaceae bacterium]
MKKGERRKLELLDIAYRMFISRGYENTSIDDIIVEAGIAKGTYYYYFESKEQTLEAVIEMMIEKEAAAAGSIVDSDLPVLQKIVGIIASIRPAPEEQPIEGALMRPENIIMHQKIKRKLVEKVVPLLSKVVEEGAEQGLFSCDNIPERVRMMLVLSNELFDEATFTDRDVDVFIDVTEKLLGAQKHSMDFIRHLIAAPLPSDTENGYNGE